MRSRKDIKGGDGDGGDRVHALPMMPVYALTDSHDPHINQEACNLLKVQSEKTGTSQIIQKMHTLFANHIIVCSLGTPYTGHPEKVCIFC